MNSAYLELYGYDSADEVIGRNVFEVGALPDEWPLLKHRTAEVLRGERVEPHTGWWAERSDGTRIRVSATGNLIEWDQQPAVVSFFRDVTPQYKASLELDAARSEADAALALLDTLQEQAPIGFAFMDRDLRYVRINATLAEINGHPAKDHIGRTLYDIIPDLAPEIATLHQHAMNGDPIVNLEINAPQPANPDESGTWLCSYFPVNDRGEVLGVGVVVVDITERKKAALQVEELQRAQAESLGLLDALQKAAPVGLAFVDCEFRFIRTNETLARIGGFDPGTCVGRTIEEVLPEVWPVMGPLYRQVRDTGEPVVNREIIAPHPVRPGEEAMFLASYYPIYRRDEMLGIGIVVVDNTERRTIELELRENDRRKDEFLAMLAHELRNPLAPIRTAVEIMRLQPDSVDHHRQAMEMVDSQVAHLVRIVDDLLDVSRITRGLIQLEKQRTDCGSILRDAVAASRPLMESRGHHFTISQPATPLKLNADATRVVQVLTNLLNNAARYTDPGGNIELTARREGDALALRVRDDGTGIPPELKPHVFDLFVQADRSLDRSSGGLGIGLTVARRLVEMHEGTIAVDSAGLGQGSEFVVRLPLAVSSPQFTLPSTAAAVSRENDGGKRLRILVVDDNEAIIQSVGTLLDLLGHEPYTALDGPTALELVKQLEPDICLVDIGLPGMNGYEVGRAIRALPNGDRTLMIAVSGYGRDKDIERSHKAGFDRHMLKPVEISQLRELLSEAATRPAVDATLESER